MLTSKNNKQQQSNKKQHRGGGHEADGPSGGVAEGGIFLFVVLYKLIGHALIYSCRPEMLQDPLRPDLMVLCCVLIRERCCSTQLAPAAKLLTDSDAAERTLASCGSGPPRVSDTHHQSKWCYVVGVGEWSDV